MKTNLLKQKLKKNIPCIGTFLRIPGSMPTEIVGLAGWDFVVFDLEHGVHSVSDIPAMKYAAAANGMSTVVRISTSKAIDVMRALDAGAESVQCPQITSVDQVREICEAARFSPLGSRGSCSYTTGAQYALTPFAEHMSTSNEQVLTIVHVENVQSANMIDQILEVPGIDVIFCGPWDLSQSLGIPGDTKNPLVKDLIKKVAKTVTGKGVACGMHIDDTSQLREWLDAGMTYITCGSDAGFLAREAKRTIEVNRAEIEKWMQSK